MALGDPGPAGPGCRLLVEHGRSKNLMCAAQAAAALIALVRASAGLSAIDPIAALVVAAIAATESVRLRPPTSPLSSA